MYRNIFRILITMVIITGRVSAQDQTNFTQFFLNPYLINPSYAGIDGQSAMSLIYKKQWSNIQDAPAIANFGLHTPVNPQMGVGLSITNDKRGLFSNSSVLVSYAYHLQLNKDQTFLRFGLSAGGAWNTVDMQRLEGFNDQKLAAILDSHAGLIGNAGVSLQSKFFHLGVSMPTIFSPSYVSEDAFSVKEVKPFQSLIFNASNRFYFNNYKHIFEPYLIYRLNADFPSQYEAAAVIHLNHVIWFGGSYKQDFGISALGGIKIKNIFTLGGAYNIKNGGANELNAPGYEISLSYLIGKQKKGSLVYSFVNAGKPKKILHQSASHAIASNKNHTQKPSTPAQKPAATKTPVQTTQKPAQNTSQPTTKPTTPVETEKPATTTPTTTASEKKPRNQSSTVEENKIPEKEPVVVTATEGHHEHEQAQIKRLAEHADDPHEHHDGSVEHPHAERHEFVKRGGHAKELPVSDYVIGGVFGKEENAKHFSEGLDKLGFDTHYGHLTAKNLWYVYIIQTENLDEARAMRDKARKTKLLRDAWLLTVHH